MFIFFLIVSIAQLIRLIYIEREFANYKLNQQKKTLENLKLLKQIDSIIPPFEDKHKTLNYTNRLLELAKKL